MVLENLDYFVNLGLDLDLVDLDYDCDQGEVDSFLTYDCYDYDGDYHYFDFKISLYEPISFKIVK